MKKGLKRGLLASLIVIGLLFATLLILPFAFQGKIMEFAKKQINEMVDAEVDFEKLSLSFIRNFPKATISLKNLVIAGEGEFAADTLLASKEIRIVVNLKSIFSDSGYEIYEILIDETNVSAHILPNGHANWDIMKFEEEEPEEVENESSDSDFKLKLNKFAIRAANIYYVDEESNMQAAIEGLNHQTTGDISLSRSLLKTYTTIDALTVGMDGINYLSKADAELKLNIDADLDAMRFGFEENEFRINAIPLSFEGWVAMPGEAIDMDVKLLAEKIDFKSILSMIPAIYANEFAGLKADAIVSLSAYIQGTLIDETYPAFDVNLSIADGWLQYPELPKSLQSIQFTAQVKNPGGDLNNTVVAVPRFSFNLGGNALSANFHLKTPMSDPDFTAGANGKIDLGMVKDFYPLGDSIELNGVLSMNIDAGGKMSYYEKEQYDKFRFKGGVALNNMVVALTGFPQKIAINHAELNFNDRYLDLPAFKIGIGRNDVSLSGRLENYVGFVLYDDVLSGRLNISSNYLNLNDLLSDGETESEETVESESELAVVEIPKNINFTMQADFKELIFDKMNFANAKGTLKVADGKLDIQNMGLNAFGGSMNVNGAYSTQKATEPKVDMDLSIKEVEFSKIFTEVGMLESFAPIFQKATGKFSMNFAFNSLLEQNMSPDLNSLAASGKLITKSVGLSDVPALTALSKALNRSDLEAISLKNLNVKFKIENGRIETEPFDIQTGDVKMTLSGSSGLDKTLAYKGDVQLPDNLNLGRLSTVGVKIGGTFTSPKVSLDVKNTISDIVDDAKTQLKEEVTKKADEAKEKLDAELQKKREELVKSAQKQADNLVREAEKAGEKLVQEAQKQGEELVNKASNAIAKKAAQAAANKMVDEAQKQADALSKKAKEEGEKLVKEAGKL